jgi:hypothetical protein
MNATPRRQEMDASSAAQPLTNEERLQRELDILTGGGIIEVAVRNVNVRHYMEHWEGRAIKAEAKVERLREALTPSTDTKCAYSGEFHIDIHHVNEDGDDVGARHMVPWVTIKDIMKAIRTYAEPPPKPSTEPSS